jgi:U5 small nuclear ribonucleoprotein component
MNQKKSLFQQADDAYDSETEILIQNEDCQPLEIPLVPTVKKQNFGFVDSGVWQTKYSVNFLACLLSKPDLVRNVALVGHLHHGKTTLIDTLIHQTHNKIKKTHHCFVVSCNYFKEYLRFFFLSPVAT